MGLTRPKVAQVEQKPKSKDKHFWASMFKSVLRLIGCYALYTGATILGGVAAVPLTMAAGLFAAAEVMGIIEELV